MRQAVLWGAVWGVTWQASFATGECVAREGEVRLCCWGEEHAGKQAGKQAEELPQRRQISVKLAGQRLDTTCPPRLYSGRWRSPLFLLGVL